MTEGVPDEALETLDLAPGDRVEAATRFAPGATIGHFRVVRELGAGGMGVVFEAHDPSLDRRVAIKVVKPRGNDAAAGARLVGEAQAMARLAHPNVVAVHEVGTVLADRGADAAVGHVFVVMELVRGETLAGWLATARPWREIVALFVGAGEGLLAAHHAGLVHRDFKPSNVFVDGAGRARVGDFGLARSDDRPAFAAGSAESGAAGTPAYMAPEQRFGEPVDARADQYAFAVSLQQALGPKHALGKAPRRVRAAIARALSIDPDARFPAMDAMLGELRGALALRKRTVAAAAAGLVALGGAAAFAFAARTSGDDCAASAQLVDGVWNANARADLLHGFAAIRPTAATASESAARLVDDWAAAWKLGRRAACSAAPTERTARAACLDARLHELRAQVAVWRTADADVVDRAVDTAAALPGPELCASASTALLVPPALVDRLAKLRADERAGKSRAAKPDALAAVAEAEAAANPAALAQALVVAGQIELETSDLPAAREHLARAAREAGRAHDDASLFEALVTEAQVVVTQGRPIDSLGLVDAADALAARGNLDHHERVARARGAALIAAGRLPEAIAALEKAVAALEVDAQRSPADRIELAAVIGELAGAYNQHFDFAKARDLLRKTLAIEEPAYGADHPEVAKTLHDLGTNEGRLADWDACLLHLNRARASFVAAYGEHSTFVGGTDMSLAHVAEDRGDLPESRKLLERARTELTGVLPEAHPYFAVIEEGLGSMDRDTDHCADALPHFRKALAMLDAAGRGGTDHATQLTNLGACLYDQKQDVEARTVLVKADAELAEAKVEPHERIEVWAVLADVEARGGKRADAIALDRRVLGATTDADPSPYKEVRSYAHDRLVEWKGLP